MPRFLCAALIAAASISAAPALAQDSYPNKPIKIVLPVPPGSALDIATRAIGEQLSVRWGQQVLIEARPGAGGLIAGQAVASAPPDGYTLLGGPASLFTILPAQKDKLPIDVNKSFVQLGMVVGSGVMFIAVTPKLVVSTFPDRSLSLDKSQSAPTAPVHCRTSRGWCWRRRQTFRSPWCPTTREAQWQRWPTSWAVAFTALSKVCLDCVARCSPATLS